MRFPKSLLVLVATVHVLGALIYMAGGFGAAVAAVTTDAEPGATAAEKANEPAVASTSDTEVLAASETDGPNLTAAHLKPSAGPDETSTEPEFVGHEIWITNFEQAKVKARDERNDILMNFTGSDWCGWCIRLNQEVFRHQEFAEYVEETFVLLELDFPNDTSHLSQETQVQNEELKSRFAVQGFPTILLADAQGRPYAQTGYQRGGVVAYVEHLKDLRRVRKVRDMAFAAANQLTGVERAKKLNDALLTISPNLVFPSYESEVEEIIRLDEGNKAGLQEQYRERLIASRFQQKVGEIEQFLQSTGDVGSTLRRVDELESEFADYDAGRLTMKLLRLQLLKIAGRTDEVLKLADAILADEDIRREGRLRVYIAKLGVLAQSNRLVEAVEAVDAMRKEFAADSNLSAQLLITKANFLAKLDLNDEGREALEEARKLADAQLLQVINNVEQRLFPPGADSGADGETPAKGDGEKPPAGEKQRAEADEQSDDAR